MNVLISMMDPAERTDCLQSSLARGVENGLVAKLIFENRALARDVLKKTRFSEFMKYPKLRSHTRGLDFLSL